MPGGKSLLNTATLPCGLSVTETDAVIFTENRESKLEYSMTYSANGPRNRQRF